MQNFGRSRIAPRYLQGALMMMMLRPSLPLCQLSENASHSRVCTPHSNPAGDSHCVNHVQIYLFIHSSGTSKDNEFNKLAGTQFLGYIRTLGSTHNVSLAASEIHQERNDRLGNTWCMHCKTRCVLTGSFRQAEVFDKLRAVHGRLRNLDAHLLPGRFRWPDWASSTCRLHDSAAHEFLATFSQVGLLHPPDVQ